MLTNLFRCNWKGLLTKKNKMRLMKLEFLHQLSKYWLSIIFRHPNIIAYKEAFFDETCSTLNIVMEFADEGDLEIKIKEMKANGKLFDEKEIWNIFIQALRGLAWLHELQILHRDLKVRIKILTAFYLVCKCIFMQKWKNKTWGFKCIKSCKARTGINSNWNSLLCKSRSLER